MEATMGVQSLIWVNSHSSNKFLIRGRPEALRSYTGPCLWPQGHEAASSQKCNSNLSFDWEWAHMRLWTLILASISLELQVEFRCAWAISDECQLNVFVAFVCGPIWILQTYSEFSQNCRSVTVLHSVKNFSGHPLVVRKTMGKFGWATVYVPYFGMIGVYQ